jgi:hypothetical protein
MLSFWKVFTLEHTREKKKNSEAPQGEEPADAQQKLPEHSW